MRYLIRKGKGFKRYPSYRKNALGFFPYEAAGKCQTLYGFIGTSEIEMTSPFIESWEQLLAPPSFWKELSFYIPQINRELAIHNYHPLIGTYLTLPAKGKKGYGICEITEKGNVIIGDFEKGMVKFRPCGWLNTDKNAILTFEDKPYTATQITQLYCR